MSITTQNRLKVLNIYASVAVISSSIVIINANAETQEDFFTEFEDEVIEAGVALALSILSIAVIAYQRCGNLSGNQETYLAYSLALIWLTGVLVFTFHEPFQFAGKN